MIIRWVAFIISILLGIAAGLLFGWYILPVQYKDTTPGTLRVDYRSDYTLMVAEIYAQDGDFPEAVRRLVFLETALPGEIVRDAILFAEPRYADADLALLRTLYLDLQTGVRSVEEPEEPTPSEPSPDEALPAQDEESGGEAP